MTGSDSLGVAKIGVVGAGLMASQLALLFARKLRVPVVISDLSEERVRDAVVRMRSRLERDAARGRLGPAEAEQIAALISGTTDPSDFAGCTAVIEAVFEELEVKRGVFRAVEAVVSPEALLLTNTSSLSVAAMAEGLRHPERVVGFHFFNPVAVLPLLELVRTPFASEAAMAAAAGLAERLGKTAVPVADSPGFVVNRLLTRLFDEVLEEIDDGGDPVAVDRALVPWGLPMTPLALIDYIGPAVQAHICTALHAAFPDRFREPASLAAVVAAGLPGFLRADGTLRPEVRELLPEPHDVDPEDVRERVRAALAEEVQLMLEEGAVGSAEDLDLCMVLGANYPQGGLTPLLAERVTA
ncbi:3-hydroxyacyl-CoA dehydrogenase family protein [Sinomonas terrae]|uniref:3-hydroxyacyl-CoA dehydrogenase family protein n=1 Tax=Sinomonas terrae TaxID=2908838 RepID=A0ABS9TX99_9MICC|nr:3-hydroxyacyl-CoA dehydrogenase family protein [Sinomonas terrae]MCH6468902.1 3-hydroxyacyl-CoA dehydrogenase family protein [Sinomonas terrae]